MKNLLLFGAIALSSFTFSQDNQDWFIRSDATIGAAFTTGNLKSYGISAGVEPKFFFNENISLGLRLEGAVLFGGNIDAEGDDVTIGLSSRAAYLLKGEYYLGDGNTKPFAGLGMGMYTQANIGTAVKDDNTSVNVGAVRAFGFAPELGVTFGNFRISGMYHIVLGSDLATITTTVGNIETVEISRNYFVVHLGFRAFGYNDK